MRRKVYHLDYHVSRRQSQTRSIGKIFFAIFLIVLLVIASKNIFFSSKPTLPKNVMSPLANGYVLGDSTEPSPPVQTTSSNLSKIVNASLANSKGIYGIDILNLKTGEEYFANEHTVFESASLYKLWVMAVVFRKIEDGSLNPDEVLSADIQALNKKFGISQEDAERKEGGITESISEALFAMITRSDNYSALLLSSKVGLSNVQNFLNDNGLTESKVGKAGNAPSTTPYDIALFLDKLYNGEFASAPITSQMIALLKQQVLNEKLPKYLPKSVIVAHKTGELDDYSHDAGIIYTENNQYIISVLTKTDSRETANETIADLSKAVYEYFQR